MHCPECDKELKEGARKCACGWKGQFASPAIPCAHDGCLDRSITRKKLPTGWANLCRKHFEFHIQREADAYCAERGLDTIDKKRAFIFKMLRGVGKQKPSYAWMDRIEQRGVNVLAASGNIEGLALLRKRGIINEENILIPVSMRNPRVERIPGEDDEEIAA